MNILALDLSTRSTGYVIGNEEGSLITYGCITQPSSKNFILRIKKIVNSIIELIQQYDIEQICCEEVRFGDTNTHTFKTLIYLQAYVVCEIYMINPKITFTFFQPNEHRAKVGIHTGRGVKREELKNKAIQYVKEKYNITVNDDIADSITLYDAYINKLDNEINWE